jgi:hypothetical protein
LLVGCHSEVVQPWSGNYYLLNDNVKVPEQREGFRQGELRFLENVVAYIDVIVGGAGEIDIGQVGLEKSTALEIGVPEITACQVGLDKVRFPDLTLLHHRVAQLKPPEVGVIYQTFGEVQALDFRGPCPVDAYSFAVGERDFTKFAVHRYDITQVALDEFAVDKTAFFEPGAGECTVCKFTLIEQQVIDRFTNDGHSG